MYMCVCVRTGVLTVVSCLPKLSGLLIDCMLEPYITLWHLMTAASFFMTCFISVCVCVCLYEGISLVSCPVKQMRPNIAWKTGQRIYICKAKKTVKHKKHTRWKWISTI